MTLKRLFRKRLILPAEHGAWSWLLVPFFVGGITASLIRESSSLSLPALALTLVGGLCAYSIRQPATLWLRAQQGRGNRTDQPYAIAWILILSLIGVLCLGGLLALGRKALLWLSFPFALVLVLYLAAALRGRASMRALWMELSGAVGLALMAPAAVIAVSGNLSRLGWALWGLMAMQNALGVLYVRLRLADTHKRLTNRLSVLGRHVAVLMAVVATGLLGWTPLLATIPFAGMLIRVAWAVRRPRPVENVRRFGFSEVGVESLSGAWIVFSYWVG
jgi:hypothetical protein